MVLWLIIAVLAAIIIWFITSRVLLVVNTQRQEYYIQYLGWFKKNIKLQDFVASNGVKQGSSATRKPKHFSRKKAIHWLRLFNRLIRTFEINEFKWVVDTGDFALSAKLYPLARWMSYYGFPTTVNFQGINAIRFKVSNRPYRLIMPLLGFVLNK